MRDALGRMSEHLIRCLKQGQTPSEAELQEAAGLKQLT
jgi:arsenate reductase